MTVQVCEEPEPSPEPANRKLAFFETSGPAPRRFFLFRPSNEVAGAPLFVSVHGITRNAAAHAYRFMREAERYGVAVVAPLFDKRTYRQYQQLQDARTKTRSDVALLDILAAASRLSHADCERILLFGYSGGAQFAHRFAMAHPGRVVSAVLAAAGWYTPPDPAEAYPYGLNATSSGPDVEFDLQEIARVRYHLIVGDLDVDRDSSLRRSEHLDRTQGRTRVERARSWASAMARIGARPTFTTLAGVGHSFTDAVEHGDLTGRVFAAFAKDAGLTPVMQGKARAS